MLGQTLGNARPVGCEVRLHGCGATGSMGRAM
jgi:hypothetical protein